MVLTDFIIDHYVEIVDLTKQKITYEQISKILLAKKNIKIKPKTIKNIMSKIKTGEIILPHQEIFAFYTEQLNILSVANLFARMDFTYDIWFANIQCKALISPEFIITNENLLTHKYTNKFAPFFLKKILNLDISDETIISSSNISLIDDVKTINKIQQTRITELKKILEKTKESYANYKLMVN